MNPHLDGTAGIGAATIPFAAARTTLLPAAGATEIARAAISAAEAIRALGTACARCLTLAKALAGSSARVRASNRARCLASDSKLAVSMAREAAEAECQVLGATLDDAGLRSDALDVWAMSGRIRAGVNSPTDLDGYEEACREIAEWHEVEAAIEVYRDTLPCSERETTP
jgi:hypothetical protein